MVKALNIAMFIGSTREGRMADRVAKLVKNTLEKKTSHKIDVIDPAVLDVPILRQPVHFYRDQSKIPKVLQDLHERVKKADLYVIITPEYNRCVPPALTNIMDHFPPISYMYKASGVVSYSMGSQGGAIANVDLRRLLCEFGAPPVPTYVCIPEVHKAIDEAGNTSNKMVEKSLDALVEDLNWWGKATKQMRDAEGVPKKG